MVHLPQRSAAHVGSFEFQMKLGVTFAKHTPEASAKPPQPVILYSYRDSYLML